jgi:hypothetical protein
LGGFTEGYWNLFVNKILLKMGEIFVNGRQWLRKQGMPENASGPLKKRDANKRKKNTKKRKLASFSSQNLLLCIKKKQISTSETTPKLVKICYFGEISSSKFPKLHLNAKKRKKKKERNFSQGQKRKNAKTQVAFSGMPC